MKKLFERIGDHTDALSRSEGFVSTVAANMVRNEAAQFLDHSANENADLLTEVPADMLVDVRGALAIIGAGAKEDDLKAAVAVRNDSTHASTRSRGYEAT